jgi:hypothetical protein
MAIDEKHFDDILRCKSLPPLLALLVRITGDNGFRENEAYISPFVHDGSPTE